MERLLPSATELLARLRPALERIFEANGLTEGQAQEIVEASCRLLYGKRLERGDPEAWLFQDIVERCRKLREEAALEDPPQ